MSARDRAVDGALWDLKARLLDVALADLLGPARTAVPVYASGGFTSRTLAELEREVAGYVAAGHTRVKIKVGREPAADRERVAVARAAAGPAAALMVDANGAYDRKQALVDVLQADATRCLGVSGFLAADALCAARGLPLSSHCAPALHVHAGAAASRLVHLEHFFDHARMEAMLFEGAPAVAGGALAFDPQRPGLGLSLRREEASRHAI